MFFNGFFSHVIPVVWLRLSLSILYMLELLLFYTFMQGVASINYLLNFLSEWRFLVKLLCNLQSSADCIGCIRIIWFLFGGG